MTKMNIIPARPNAAGKLSFGLDQGPDVLDPVALGTDGTISFAAAGTAGNAYDTTISRSSAGVVAVNGGMALGGGTPVLAAGANAGTSPPAPVLGAGSNDNRGSLTCGSGTTPATGALVTVTFSAPLSAAPFVTLTETTTAASLLNPAVTNVTANGFTISVGTAPAGSQANTVYGFAWALTR